MSSKILQLGSEKIQSKQSYSRSDWVWAMTASRSIDTEITLATDTRKLIGKNPLQYSCLENPHGQRSLVGYSPCGHKKSDTTEQLNTTQHSTGLKQEREYTENYIPTEYLEGHGITDRTLFTSTTQLLFGRISKAGCEWTNQLWERSVQSKQQILQSHTKLRAAGTALSDYT